MLKVGLVGLGFMGSSHLSVYKKMIADGLDVEVVAICDVCESKFTGKGTQGNLDTVSSDLDLSSYNLYTDMEEMIEKEDLDFVDLAVPTFIHDKLAIIAMKKGVDVFCEKPMAICYSDCQDMIKTSKETGKKLMIGQTLRYWNTYEYLKETIDNNSLGKVTSGYFFRGGSTPIWSWENWLLTKDRSGGALLDQHIHDVDAINWLFGVPKAVSTIGKIVYEGSGYDALSTNYIYENNMVINAQDDWTINGKGFGFKMMYRVNFEKGAIVYEQGKTTVYPVDGEMFEAPLTSEDAYYKEIRLFMECIKGDDKTLDLFGLLESHAVTIKIGECEIESADKMGQPIEIK
ncbi:MAG: Gfo/Idh/MocA family protein [Lachnospirales bacterium]